MPNAQGQHTDAENAKAPMPVSKPGDDLTQVSSKSTQEIARDRSNQNTVAGSGADAVTAPGSFHSPRRK